MDIDVFFKNDDLSFGFTGDSAPRTDEYAFSKTAEFGFPDVDYSYANGNSFKKSKFNDVSDSVNATGREAEVAKWWAITDADKKDCKAMDGHIAALQRAIDTQKKKLDSAKGSDKNVQRDYLTLYMSRLDYFQNIYEGAGCELAKTEKENSEFQNMLNQVTGGKSDSKMGTYLLVIGGILVVGIVGVIVYKKFKNKT